MYSWWQLAQFFCFLSGLSPSLQEPGQSFCSCDLMAPSALSGSSISRLLICAFLAHWVTSELQEKTRYILFKGKRKKKNNQTSIVLRVGKMAQWIKIPGELSSIPGTRIRSGGRKPDSTKDILWPPHVYHVIWGHVHPVNKWINGWIFVDHYKRNKSI